MAKWKMQTTENEALTSVCKKTKMNVILVLIGVATLVAAGLLLKSPEDDQ